MAASVTAATSGAAAAALGQQVDDLALEQGGVGVHDDQVLGPAVQPGHLDREVDLAAGRLLGQGAPQAVEVGTGHGQLVAVHRVGGEPDDPLDVAAARAMPPVTPSSVGGVDLGRQHRDEVPLGRLVQRASASTSGSTVTSTPGRRRSAVRARRAPRSDLARRRQVDLDAEQQPAVHPDLLHVVDLDAALGQRGEEPLGDARAVLAAHRHQER